MPKKKLSSAERKKVEDQIAALQESLDDAEEASPEEQAAADADVEEQKKKTAALFDRLGLTEDDWTVLSAAFAAGTEDRTRRIVREELAAEEEEGEGEGEGGAGTLAEAADDPEGAGPVAQPKDDDEPVPTKHWTDKKIFGKSDEEEDGPKDG